MEGIILKMSHLHLKVVVLEAKQMSDLELMFSYGGQLTIESGYVLGKGVDLLIPLHYRPGMINPVGC